MSYIVTAPLVIAKKADGSDVYLYEGAPVPTDTPNDEIDRLAEGGFIAKPAAAEKAIAAKSADNK